MRKCLNFDLCDFVMDYDFVVTVIMQSFNLVITVQTMEDE